MLLPFLATAVFSRTRMHPVALQVALQPSRMPICMSSRQTLELPASMREELLAISEPEGAKNPAQPPRMPTIVEMRKAGRDDLAELSRRTGSHAIAKQLGLRIARGRRPSRGEETRESLEEERARVGRELLEFAASREPSFVMPTVNELQVAGKHALLWALRRTYGGLRPAAENYGLAVFRRAPVAPLVASAHGRRARGYWLKFEHLQRELLSFIDEHGTPGTMPTGQQLRLTGRHGLAHAISAHGGLHAVARKAGLRMAHGRAPARHWRDLPTLKRALVDFAAANGTAGVMPTVLELQTHGRHDLARAVSMHHGGRIVLERETGLRYVRGGRKRTPRGYWLDHHNIQAELLAYVGANGTAGVMPSRLELLVSSPRSRRLLRAIEEEGGGLVEMAAATGLHVPPERFGVWVIDTTSDRQFVRGGRWQRQVATVDPEAILGHGSAHRWVRDSTADEDVASYAALDSGPSASRPSEPEPSRKSLQRAMQE